MKITWGGLGNAALNVLAGIPLAIGFFLLIGTIAYSPKDIPLALAGVVVLTVFFVIMVSPDKVWRR
jgi:hypothetical protein